MDYKEAVRYLNEETTEGIKPDLSRINLLCELLGNPQKTFSSIHITGTNGKTTTARLMDSILIGAGVRSGYYTSPHLVSYTERFKANGSYISEDAFARLVGRIAPLVGQVNERSEESVTQFEALTAIAFQYFSDEKLDCAVVEVGMGGSWDATNMVDGRVAVITNVELEHTDRLGESVEKIAVEKAGVIKARADVVTAARQPSVIEILKARSDEQNARFFVLGRDFHVDVVERSVSEGTQILDIKTVEHEYSQVRLNLIGGHQAVNAGLGVTAAELFLKEYAPQRLKVVKDAVVTALSRASSPGRLEVVAKRPMIVLDGAHNPPAAHALGESLEKDFDYDRLILVLGVLADKDVKGIVGALADKADMVIATQSMSHRSLSAGELAEAISKTNAEVIVCEQVAEAVEQAKKSGGRNDMILITGSIYTIGEAKEYLGE